MADALYQNPPSVSFVYMNGPAAGKLTREAWLFLAQVMQRIGGAIGFSPAELEAIIEEVQAGAAETTMQPLPPADDLADLLMQTVPPEVVIFTDVTPPAGAPSDAAAVAVAVGASPFTYTPPMRGLVVVNGGTVSALAYVRRGASTTLGVVAGPVELSHGDALTVTYAVAPTITFIPR